MNGKGSARRPTLVSLASFAENWDRIFGERQKPPPEGSGPAHTPAIYSPYSGLPLVLTLNKLAGQTTQGGCEVDGPAGVNDEAPGEG